MVVLSASSSHHVAWLNVFHKAIGDKALHQPELQTHVQKSKENIMP
jgi:hypothetical protein